MGKEATTPCASCEQLREQLTAQQTHTTQLLDRLTRLEEAHQTQQQASQATIDLLQARVTDLETQLARARKDSSTSSKPPSSDIVRPPKPQPPPGQSQRQRGGQPGHPKHERALFPPELLAGDPHHYQLDTCPDCGHGLRPAGDDVRIVQQIELPPRLVEIEDHHSHPGWCARCCKVHYAPLPAEVQRGGLAGPRLTTLIAYLKGVCHASYSTVRKFLRDVLQVTISRSQLVKILGKVTAALDKPYQELLDELPGMAFLNVDETGHQRNGVPWWTWCFRAELFTLFKVDISRSSNVLIKVLGEEFKGVLGCDYFSAYRRYMRLFEVPLQFCLAHLIRDVKFLKTLPDAPAQAYGERLCEALRRLFGVIHRREELSTEVFEAELQAAREAILEAGMQQVPASKPCQNMAKRFRVHGESYFRFLTTPGVEPTNNLAEQAIRFVVIDRLITQGTRSEAGDRWCERIWTVIATCAQQGKSVFDYLYAAVCSHFRGQESPSLLGVGG